MGAFLSAVLAWLLGVVTRFFTFAANHFIATKIIMVFLFVTIIPIVLNNFLYGIMEIMFNVTDSLAGDMPEVDVTLTFSSLAGWLISTCKIPESLSVIMSAVCFRFALSWIPFVGPR